MRMAATNSSVSGMAPGLAKRSLSRGRVVYPRAAVFDSESTRGLYGDCQVSKILYAVRREFQHPANLNGLEILHAVRGECLPVEQAEDRSNKTGV